MSDFGVFSGKEFFELQFPERKFLVDKIMREKDSVLFVGGEKAGKSVLIKQLICSLVTGTHPFLDEYEVLKPCKVTYVQLEGELGDTQDRFKRMITALDFNTDNFQMIFLQPQRLHEKDPLEALMADIEMFHKPDVIIIDPLYFACVGGSISDDEHIIKFTGNMRVMKDHFGCSLVIVHHTHKVKLTKDGDVMQEGDDATFGSTFLKAWPDHLILFTYNKKTGLRHMSCGTQRSGDIVKNLALELIQPNPLYFRRLTDPSETGRAMAICELLNRMENLNIGLTADQICHALEIKRSTFYKNIKQPLSEKMITKDDSKRPVIYRVLKSPISV